MDDYEDYEDDEEVMDSLDEFMEMVETAVGDIRACMALAERIPTRLFKPHLVEAEEYMRCCTLLAEARREG